MLLLWEQEFGPLPEPIDDIIVRCRTYVMKAAPHLLVVDANMRIARAARARGQRLAIGSNSSTNTVTWSDVAAGRGKPAPDIFLLAAQRLRAEPQLCLVYEDADAGVAAALAAGMTAYNVWTGHLRHP